MSQIPIKQFNCDIGICLIGTFISLWLESLSSENKTETDNATKHDTDTHNENGSLKLDIGIWNLFVSCILVIGNLARQACAKPKA